MKKIFALLCCTVLLGACNRPSQANLSQSESDTAKTPTLRPPLIGRQWAGVVAPGDPSGQISEYVRRVFEDSKGNLWFGTNGDGVCRKDRNSLTYFSVNEGFAGAAVRGILEDEKGDIWFGTDGGVSRFDGSSFRNYSLNDGLSGNDVWSIFRDHKGTIWVGTNGGVSRHDPAVAAKPGAKMFSEFPLPDVDIAQTDPMFPPRLVWAIAEDKLGNMWFGTNGFGVRKYDGKDISILTKKDGLAGDNVSSVLADHAGNLWFGTREEGLSRYDGKSWTTFTEKDGLCYSFVWTLIEDDSGNSWIGTAGGGCCRFDGKTFSSFSEKDGLVSKHVQSIFQGQSGRLWFGCSGGLCRLEGNTFVNVLKLGPW